MQHFAVCFLSGMGVLLSWGGTPGLLAAQPLQLAAFATRY